MKTTFNKAEFNTEFDHTKAVEKIFSDLGFNNIEINSSFTNGASHYINVYGFAIINENKLHAEMFVFDGMTDITVRISDHLSNLDTVCNGVSGNKMNLDAFKELINTGAIAPK